MGSTRLHTPNKRVLHQTSMNSCAMHDSSSKRCKPIPNSSTASASFRLLCPASFVSGVIGKAGNVIKRIQQQTDTKIRIEDFTPPCPDRVISIIGPKASHLSNGDVGNADGEQDDVSKVQDALVKVFERILEVGVENRGLFGAEGEMVSCRLLAEPNHAGGVIGKGGKVVEKIKKDCGCKIRVCADNLPECCGPTEEMIEIGGDVLAVTKGLVAVSSRLQDCQPLDNKTTMASARPVKAAHQDFLLESRGDMHSHHRYARAPVIQSNSINQTSCAPRLSLEPDRFPISDAKAPAQHEVVFKILCSNDRVGCVIGKGGNIIRALQNETGASISIGALNPDYEERLITITASENMELQYSAAQEAVVLVFAKSMDAGMEKGVDLVASKESSVIARLVITSNQVGCVMGKGGAIVSKIRNVTGTNIRIIGGEQVPKCISQNEQIVQISGEILNVKEAIYHVTGRIRENLYSTMVDDFGSASSSMTNKATSLGRFSAPSMDSLDVPSMGRVRNHHLPLDLHPSGQPTTLMKRRTGVDLRDMPDEVGRGLPSFRAGSERSSGASVIVTNTTVEIVVPDSVVGVVFGEKGSNLTRLRQISGAKVTVHEPRLGTGEKIIVISGSPDETQAAQSLLQAFVRSGR